MYILHELHYLSQRSSLFTTEFFKSPSKFHRIIILLYLKYNTIEVSTHINLKKILNKELQKSSNSRATDILLQVSENTIVF